MRVDFDEADVLNAGLFESERLTAGASAKL
jgi:hypothetical protein